MNERDRIRDEKLTRLLKNAGPESIPALEPDPHLPTRIRAMTRDGLATPSTARKGAPGRLRWAWLSLGTAALAASVLVGGFIGYRAGTSSTTTLAAEESTSDDVALWNAWSQSGFEEDLLQLNTGNGEVAE